MATPTATTPTAPKPPQIFDTRPRHDRNASFSTPKMRSVENHLLFEIAWEAGTSIFEYFVSSNVANEISSINVQPTRVSDHIRYHPILSLIEWIIYSRGDLYRHQD